MPSWTKQGYGIFNRAYGVTMLAGWYPVLALYGGGWETPAIPSVGDAMFTDISLYEVALTVPGHMTVVSTGTVTRVETDGSQATWHMVSGPAREFACAVSDHWAQQTISSGGVRIHLYTLAAGTPSTTAPAALQIANRAFSTYTDLFGPYPFAEFDIVETFVSIGGYEFSGMVATDLGKRAQGGRADYEWLVAHETAHQWWYGLVGGNPMMDAWLDESFATYSTALYFETTQGRSAYDRLIASWRRAYCTPSASSPPITSPSSAFTQWSSYNRAIPQHGALFLDALRSELGDDAFFALLRRYADRYRFGRATPAGLLDLAQQAADHDLSPLFQRWHMAAAYNPAL